MRAVERKEATFHMVPINSKQIAVVVHDVQINMTHGREYVEIQADKELVYQYEKVDSGDIMSNRFGCTLAGRIPRRKSSSDIISPCISMHVQNLSAKEQALHSF